MSKKVFIVAANRSPIASFNSVLKDVTVDELGVQVVTKMLDKNHIPKQAIDEVIVGNVISAGLGQNVARQISIKAGIPNYVPAYSLNMVCGSGMKSVMNGFLSIKAGFSNLVVTGGVESMSNAPYLVTAKTRSGVKMGNLELQDTILRDALMDSFSPIHMGITAENIAEKHNLTREELDKFSYESQLKAIHAVDTDRFADEIIPIEIKSRKETIVFDKDEYPNRSTSLEKLAKLRPVFKPDGIVTAGSSSGINDGASFVDRLVLFNTAVYTTPWLRDIGRSWIKAGRHLDGEAYYFTTIPIIYSPYFYENNQEWFSNRKKLLVPLFSNELFINQMERLTISSESYNVLDELNKVTAHTLIVSSEEDYLTPIRDQELLARKIKNSHWVKIPNAGHASMYEQPMIFASLCLGFINIKDTLFSI